MPNFVVHLQTTTRWTYLLLVCACCHEIPPAACKPEWMKPQFPCDVQAHNTSGVQFDCKKRALKAIPHGITPNVTDLNLSENYINKIQADSLSHLTNLTRLNLGWANNRKGLTIDVGAFKNLTKLRELILNGNRLEKIPDNLPGDLETLGLASNKILYLDEMSFTGLTNLTTLWLGKNCYSWNACGKFTRIMDNTFAPMTKLRTLDLSFNNLTHVPTGLPPSLHVLMLASNRIQYISEIDFVGLPYLKVLKVQGNCPRCQNAPYPCVPCQNGSLGIHPKAFCTLTELEELNLGGNSLTYLNPSLFKSLGKLRNITVSFNFLIKEITEGGKFLTYLPRLEKIDLSFNFALKEYPHTLNLSKHFSALGALRTLHLEGLVFQRIGPGTLQALYQLGNLSALNLGTNFIIQYDSNIFSNFAHLKMIYLAENRLYPIPVKEQSHPSDGHNHRSDLSVSTFTTSHPQEFEISHGFIKQECFNAGRVLVLSSNNLFFISSEQFKQYGDIACLNLSRNGFSSALNGTEFSSLFNLTYLDLSFNKIDLAYDHAFSELQKLEVLDLSYNSHYFKAYGITHNLLFLEKLPVLRVLNMSSNSISTLTTKRMYSKSLKELQFRDNNLGTLWKDGDNSYIQLFTNLVSLEILDISHNHIKKIPDNVYEHWPRNLTILRISHNLLTDYKWDTLKHFNQLQILDLSFNSLSDVTGINTQAIPTLTFLDLSHNGIFHLDEGFLKGAKSLKTLSLSYNRLTVINQSTFHSGPESHIETLFLWKNPFQCTCDSLDFIVWIENSDVHLPRLTTDVTCDTPEKHKGQPLIKFKIDQCVNDSEAFLMYILSSSFILLFMVAATVSHLFYWDASYVLHYMKAKLKGYSALNSSDCVYDVFVTYDTRDPHVSEWVMKDLRVKLEEEGEKSLPLCLEERDWPPGVPLLDNLIQSIRYSRKTMFVLTSGYVKSGVFKLAIYLAHQRLLDESVDVIVLLLLEPVLQHSHFLHLRRRMCGRSVVEWPKTAAAEPWFWQNLRNVIRVDNQVMYNKAYSKYFSSR